jgi:signal transduction histidine kinase
MGENGKLTIRVSATHTDRVSGDNTKDNIVIEVTDTGRGIDEKDMEHIFDPYFTTRPEGTGLGLAMVHRAVEALAGDISVESEHGRGTSFFIVLPCR